VRCVGTIKQGRGGEARYLSAGAVGRYALILRISSVSVHSARLRLTLQRLAALVPRPRLHLIRYHGVLAPNSKLRARVVPQGPPARAHLATGVAAPAECEQAEPVRTRAQLIGWARLLKRVFDIDLRRCPSCGAGALKIIAAILQRAAIGKILTHLGLDPRPPPRGRASEAGHAFAAD
jgi:hypothetical protein